MKELRTRDKYEALQKAADYFMTQAEFLRLEGECSSRNYAMYMYVIGVLEDKACEVLKEERQ